MTRNNSNTIYEQNTIDFVTVALEYCSWLESVVEVDAGDFVDKATKLLPLLYLRAALLPDVETEEEAELELCITEDMYESVLKKVASILGERDSYLETFHPDMPFSDTPVAVFISEDLADVYQDVGNFCYLFRQGYEEVMLEAVAMCRYKFCDYWGQRVLNALKALHSVRYNVDDIEMMKL